MEIIKAYAAPEFDNPHKVSARLVHSTEHIEVVLITLQPGETLKPHTTPVDATFYGVEGQGVVVIGDETAAIGPNDLVPSPKGHVHLLRNESTGVFRFLVLKTPRPAKPGKGA
jgi:mannose-6-phosphate isomerase-like protein (cupin superfamily)